MKRLKRLYYSISFRITLIILVVCNLVANFGGKMLSTSISLVSNISECNRTADHVSTMIQDKVLQTESLLNAGALAESNGMSLQQVIKVCQPLKEFGLVDSIYILRKSEAPGEVKLRLEQKTDNPNLVFWCEPYVQDNRFILTAFIELANSNRLLCANANTNWQERMSIYSPNTVANIFVLSANGKYVFHLDKEMLGKTADGETKESKTPFFGSEIEVEMDSLFAEAHFEPDWHTNFLKMMSEFGLGTVERRIEHTDWLLICSMPTNGVSASDGKTINGIVLGQMGFLFFLLSIIIIVFVRRTVRPLRDITDATEEIAKGHFDVPLPKIRSHTDIRLLRDRFESMQHKLAEYVEDLKLTTEQKVTMERDLQIAHEIQQDMLPQTFPAFPERKDLDIYGLQLPARQVGGDLFDFHMRDEKLFFCIGDVSGKGVPAALFMAVTCRLFHYALRQTANPREIVAAINNEVAQGNERNMFCTLFVGVLDMATGELSFCNAGHNVPILMRGRACRFMECKSNIPTGVFEGYDYQCESVQLEAGDTLFLYTDGVTEAESLNKEYYGDEATLQAVCAQSGQPMQTLAENILAGVRAFAAGAEQSDDLTILCLNYIPK